MPGGASFVGVPEKLCKGASQLAEHRVESAKFG
jgi:hypothetical protein